MRIFKSKAFARFVRRARITNAVLRETVGNIEKGLIDANLGGGVLKQRLARAGAGKSRGFRVLVVVRTGERAFFVHGFVKSERDNIRDDELEALIKARRRTAGL